MIKNETRRGGGGGGGGHSDEIEMCFITNFVADSNSNRSLYNFPFSFLFLKRMILSNSQ